MPRAFYRLFTKHINSLFSDVAKYEGEICDEAKNICRFKMACDKITGKKEIDFGFQIYDEAEKLFLNIDWTSMY